MKKSIRDVFHPANRCSKRKLANGDSLTTKNIRRKRSMVLLRLKKNHCHHKFSGKSSKTTLICLVASIEPTKEFS